MERSTKHFLLHLGSTAGFFASLAGGQLASDSAYHANAAAAYYRSQGDYVTSEAREHEAEIQERLLTICMVAGPVCLVTMGYSLRKVIVE